MEDLTNRVLLQSNSKDMKQQSRRGQRGRGGARGGACSSRLGVLHVAVQSLGVAAGTGRTRNSSEGLVQVWPLLRMHSVFSFRARTMM